MALSHSSNSIRIFEVAILVVYKRVHTSTGSNFFPDDDGRLSNASVYDGNHFERLSRILNLASFNNSTKRSAQVNYGLYPKMSFQIYLFG